MHDDRLAGFSSYGVTCDGFVNPEIVAPGRHIVGPVPASMTLTALAPRENQVEPGYLRINGTSFAAPQFCPIVVEALERVYTENPDVLGVPRLRAVPAA